MSKVISTRILQNLKPHSKPYFLRGTDGLGVKVNPSGTIKFIIEAKVNGKSFRKTIGSFPQMPLNIAKATALTYIHKEKRPEILRELLKRYLTTSQLKPNTTKDYSTVIPIYLSDWMDKKVSDITKEMVEQRFYKIRDKGINGGIPTYSQATKVMRILSALCNYAMADDTITTNPVDILKQKRVKRSIVKRNSYLTKKDATTVLKSLSEHPVEQAIALMLYAGLRKTEALSIQWENVSEDLIIIKDTKNHREHLTPITEKIQIILDTITKGSSPFLFPSPIDKQRHIKDVRPTLKRIEEQTGISFKCHDLRRTFATRASEVGIDYLMIKRLLNHKTNDITAQYIQWDSKENLQKMKMAMELIQYDD